VNPKFAALGVLLLILGAVVLIIALSNYVASSPVRRRELMKEKKERLSAVQTILAIEQMANQYSTIDSVLATQVKDLINEYRQKEVRG
jgi:hypothetical protein